MLDTSQMINLFGEFHICAEQNGIGWDIPLHRKVEKLCDILISPNTRGHHSLPKSSIFSQYSKTQQMISETFYKNPKRLKY